MRMTGSRVVSVCVALGTVLFGVCATSGDGGELLMATYPTALPAGNPAAPPLTGPSAGSTIVDFVDIGETTGESGHYISFSGSNAWGPVVGQSVPRSGNWDGEGTALVLGGPGAPDTPLRVAGKVHYPDRGGVLVDPCGSDLDCDDGQFCNGGETCNETTETCDPGTPPDCSDGDSGTIDYCDPAAGACFNVPSFDPSDGTITDSMWVSGMELGGIGVGKLEMRTNGEIGNFTINNNWDKWIERAKGTFLAIHVNNADIKKNRILRRSYSGGSDYSGTEAIDHIRYRGMFPKLKVNYFDSLPIAVELNAFSPLIPQNTADSSLPVAFLTFDVTNESSNDVEVSVAFSWENILGRGGYDTWSNGSQTWNSVSGNFQENVDLTDLQGIRFKTTQSHGDVKDNSVGEYMLLAAKGAGFEISTHNSWNVLDATPSFWSEFEDDGTLTDPASPPSGSDGSYEPAGTVAVKTALSPSETKQIRFMVVWFMQTHITASDGIDHGHAYLSNPATDTPDEIAEYAYSNLANFLDATTEWQDLVLNSNLPFWLKLRMINGIFTMFANSVYPEDLHFYTHESLISMRGSLGTSDQRMCFHPFYTMMFPGLDQDELTTFGDVRPGDGRVSHFNGNVGWKLHSSDVGYGVTNWPDLSCSYVMQVLKSYKWTGAMTFLDDNWQEVQEAMAWLESADSDGDYIPEGGSTYDYEGQNPGAFVYTASAYLGALKAAEELAWIKGNTPLADDYAARFSNARATVMSNLWTGDYFRKYYRVSDGASTPNSFIASLAGDWLSRYSTTGRTLDVDVTKSAENHILNWHQDLFPDVVAPMEVAPDGDDPADNCYQYQHEPYIGMESIYDGYVDEGLGILHSIYEDHWEKAQWPWNGRIHPSVYGSGKTGGWNGNYYMSNPATWSVLNALSGSSIDVPNQILYLAPHLPAGWSELHAPIFFPTFWAWLDFDHATGQVDIEIVKTFGSAITINKTIAELASGDEAENTTVGLPFTASVGQTLTYYIPVDNTAPAAISDLAASWTGSQVQLVWTATGDDGTTGRCLRYDLRHSLSTIDDPNWDLATQVTREPYPATADAQETFFVPDNLDPDTIYYFAMKSKDEEGNWSALSNVDDVFTGVAECTTDEDCDDEVDCTDDTCPAGSCVFTPNNANCPDDSLYCNGTEFCDVVADCSHTGDPCLPLVCNETTDTCDECQVDDDCDDGVGCTDDTCVASSCVFTPDDTYCPDDGLYCNGTEFCDAVAACSHTGDPCPPLVCNEITDACDECQVDDDCDDGLFCNGVETCDVAGTCQPGTDPCTADEACNEASDVCCSGTGELLTSSYPTSGTGWTTVPGLVGLPGGAALIDFVDVGDPSCETGHDMDVGCVGTGPNGHPCWGSVYSWGGSSERPIWEPGTSGSTSVDASLTVDFGPGAVSKYVGVLWLWGDAGNSCPSGSTCGDSWDLDISGHSVTFSLINTVGQTNEDEVIGVFDVGVVTGVRTLTFTATDDPWTGQTSYGQALISEIAIFGSECYADTDCDDGLYCNGAETCVDGVCQAGTAPDCDDGVSCTDDSCDEGTDMCTNTSNDANCDDGDICTDDWCDSVLGCSNVPRTLIGVTATVQLAGVVGPVTRCIEFTPKYDVNCSTPVSVDVEFFGNPATGVATLLVECNSWTELCAKDEQHTLIDTISMSGLGDAFQGDSDLVLLGGDTDNDSDVDINDVTYLIYTYGNPTVDGGCAWDGTRDADFSNSFGTGSDDYTFIVEHWHQSSTCTCTAPLRKDGILRIAGAASVDARSSVVASTLPHGVATQVDLNDDGVFDFRDVREFEQRYRLGHALSLKMQRTMSPLGRPTGRAKDH